jgi:hypothetical protein
MAVGGPAHRHHGGVCGLRQPSPASCSPHGVGAGPAHRRPAGSAGLAQADLALCGAGLWGPDLDRADGRDPAAGGADRAGPGRGLPAGRQGRPRGGRGGPRPRSWLGDGDAGGGRSRHPIGGRRCPPGGGGRAQAGRDQLPQGHPPGTDPVCHWPGGPGRWSAAGGGGRPHQASGGRLARRPDPLPGWPRSPWSP